MSLNKMLVSAIVCSALFASTAAAQDARAAQGARPELASACGGAWQQVQDAVASLRRLDPVTTDEQLAKLDCLVTAISNETFHARDPQFDQVLRSEKVRVLVGTYGPANYDVIARFLPAAPERVRQPLIAALIERGQPEAFEAYFADKRAPLASGRGTEGSAASVAVFSPLIERGACAAAVCSNRISETLRIVHGNLDIVAAQMAQASRGSGESDRDRRIRADAKRLGDEIEKVRRGELTIGQIE